MVNIGGIANVTRLSADGGVTGFDTGPGNCLLDAWARRHLRHAYDANGAWAATGSRAGGAARAPARRALLFAAGAQEHRAVRPSVTTGSTARSPDCRWRRPTCRQRWPN